MNVQYDDFDEKAQWIIDAGAQLYASGMVPATSGNISTRLKNGNIAITISGRHKGRLIADDIMQVQQSGQPIGNSKPSAETLLHCQIYERFKDAQMVIHPHSLASTLLSKTAKDQLHITDYELIKAFPNITSHKQQIVVPIVENSQDMQELVAQLAEYFQENDNIPAYLIAGHGFYTWGKDKEACLNHVEALEFIFQCELQLRRMKS